jgi:hypothetical protein
VGAVDDLRRALIDAYGHGLILNGMSAEDLVDAAVEEVRRERRRTTRADHRMIADYLRSRPGTWGDVSEYGSSDNADDVARMLQTARHTSGAYAPAGSYEARVRQTGSGFLVEARYVGESLADASAAEIPPEERADAARSERTRTDHLAVADRLRSRPGAWGAVGDYSTRGSAKAVVGVIRAARGGSGAFYAPAGSYEARLKEAGVRFLVEARYVGDGA